MDDCLPIFSLDYGYDSILTVDAVRKDGEGNFDIEIKEDEPTNLAKLSLKHNLDITFIVCPNFTPYWAIYKVYKEIDKQWVFLWKVCCCSDVKQKDDNSELTECNIYIALKNSEAYYKIVKYVTEANTVNFHKKSRIDWATLRNLYDENYFEVFIPFYSGPLAKNLLKYNSICAPKWGKIKPIHLSQNQGLPFDEIINEATIKYCEINKFPIIKAWHCYTYMRKDVEALQTYLCIQNRSVLNKPELKAFSSDRFNFESFLKEKV